MSDPGKPTLRKGDIFTHNDPMFMWEVDPVTLKYTGNLQRWEVVDDSDPDRLKLRPVPPR